MKLFEFREIQDLLDDNTEIAIIKPQEKSIGFRAADSSIKNGLKEIMITLQDKLKSTKESKTEE